MIRTELQLECPCGAKSPVFQGKKGKWHSHCINCGRLTFWSNPMLTERLRYDGQLCSHEIEPLQCKEGFTTWCKICRVRSFIYAKESGKTRSNTL